MSEFTPVASLVGGSLIGLSASLLLLVHGRIAGVSGILGGVLSPERNDTQWRVLFVLGLVTGGGLLAVTHPAAFGASVLNSPVTLTLAGVLVGFGTRLGNGCTSGHGVCETSRGSPPDRSCCGGARTSIGDSFSAPRRSASVGARQDSAPAQL